MTGSSRYLTSGVWIFRSFLLFFPPYKARMPIKDPIKLHWVDLRLHVLHVLICQGVFMSACTLVLTSHREWKERCALSENAMNMSVSTFWWERKKRETETRGKCEIRGNTQNGCVSEREMTHRERKTEALRVWIFWVMHTRSQITSFPPQRTLFCTAVMQTVSVCSWLRM